MRKKTGIKSSFVDIGGVLLANGWGYESRKLATNTFNLDLNDINNRHHVIQDTYEMGKPTIKEYLSHVMFYPKRSSTPAEFQKFIFVQIAEGLGIRGVCHTDYTSTCAKLASFELELSE